VCNSLDIDTCLPPFIDAVFWAHGEEVQIELGAMLVARIVVAQNSLSPERIV